MKYFYFLIVLLCSGCQSPEKLLSNAHWLLGTWETKTDKGSLYETWRKGDRHNLLAKSYFLNGADTILFETIQLQARNSKLYYVVNPPGTNHDSEVTFESTSVVPNGLSFENKLHDFPQVITYRQVSTDSLLAEISGIINGKEEREQFPMRKIK